MTNRRDPTFGVVGLGNVGAGIASRLARAGTTLGTDLDAARRELVRERYAVRPCSTVDELGREADIVILSLPTPEASRTVVEQLSTVLRHGSVVIETSTVNSADIETERSLLEPHGIRLVDAAVVGGVAAMYAGHATLLIGGDPDALVLASPALDAITSNQLRLGPLGSGMATKVLNNAIAHAVMVVLVEAFAIARATGVDAAVLVELLRREDAGLIRPLTHRIVERVIPGNYEGGMTTQAARKDSALVLKLAQDVGVPIFAIQAAHPVYEIAVNRGLGRYDYASIALLWDDWAHRCDDPQAHRASDQLSESTSHQEDA